jgi:hypothetical protein
MQVVAGCTFVVTSARSRRCQRFAVRRGSSITMGATEKLDLAECQTFRAVTTS